MSINAITSVSLYEYYYQINNSSKTKKEKEADKVSDDEPKNTAEVKDKKTEEPQEPSPKKEVSFDERPWADIMEQLDLKFNPNPKDDVAAIQTALSRLIQDIDDDELLNDIYELGSYIKSMYVTYFNNDYDVSKVSSSLSKELENLSIVNKAFAF